MFFFLSFISFYCYFPPNFSYFAFIVHIYTYVTSSCLDLVASSLFFLVFKNSLYSYSMFYKMFLLFVGAFSTHFLSFSLILCIVYRRFESPFYRQPPMVIPPFIYILDPPPPPFLPPLTTFIWQYCPNDKWDKHKNKPMRKSYFIMFKRLQISVTFFFI